MQKRIYYLHRKISLIIAIPVLLWAASGFMHPIMTNIRPNLKQQKIAPITLDKGKILLGLKQVLSLNHLSSIHNARLVHIDTNWFYQVQTEPNADPLYLGASNAKKLKNGDQVYARYLTRLFLEGQKEDTNDQSKTLLNDASRMMQANKHSHDCCESATRFVFSGKQGAPVLSVKKIISFDEEYGEVNKILPVYKVSFQRQDSIRVYVETTQDRFVYAVDDKRAFFDKIFGLFHTWDWLDTLGSFKLYVMALLMLLTLFSSFLGLYIFFTTKNIRPNGRSVLRWRYNHRWVSAFGSLFSLMFVFSGACHVIGKLIIDQPSDYLYNQKINPDKLVVDGIDLDKTNMARYSNFSLVRMRDSVYWRLELISKDRHPAMHQSMPAWSKENKMQMPEFHFFSVANGSLLKNGEKEYAVSLANQFRGNSFETPISVTPVTRFEGEYGFVNKRLPVWKVQYEKNHHERLYIETATANLAARMNDINVSEGYIFSFLHKHHFMDFAGKAARDFSSMFWAAMQVILVLVGLVYFFFRSGLRR